MTGVSFARRIGSVTSGDERQLDQLLFDQKRLLNRRTTIPRTPGQHAQVRQALYLTGTVSVAAQHLHHPIRRDGQGDKLKKLLGEKEESNPCRVSWV